ncbi:response regulator transcription factor [bacterium]|nr:response regulator transcription factor [bacterium]
MTIANLSERETRVLLEIINGKSNEMIAHQLYISLSTVKAHVSSIIHKLNVRNRVEAAVKATQIMLAESQKEQNNN